MIEQTYHEVLSTAVQELLHPLLVVLSPYVRLSKQLHWARLTSKRRSLKGKKDCELNIFISNNKLINDIFHLN